MFDAIYGRVLDASVYWSFDRTGYLRHQESFRAEDLAVSLTSKVVLVTGANSGLGYSLARSLLGLGARVYLLCRSEAKGWDAIAKIRESQPDADVHLAQVDLASPTGVRSFADAFVEPRVDVLVHNAGLLPLERLSSPDGFEMTYAVHVLGPHRLTEALLPKLRASEDARVITISSGGMYSVPLQPDRARNREEPYRGTYAYARTKRAQVVLSRLWQQRWGGEALRFGSMHPGWAATPGVESSLPAFYQRLGDRLRSPEEGIDTALWMAVREEPFEPGGFYFDRGMAPEHLFFWTRRGGKAEETLWAQVVDDA